MHSKRLIKSTHVPPFMQGWNEHSAGDTDTGRGSIRPPNRVLYREAAADEGGFRTIDVGLTEFTDIPGRTGAAVRVDQLIARAAVQTGIGRALCPAWPLPA